MSLNPCHFMHRLVRCMKFFLVGFVSLSFLTGCSVQNQLLRSAGDVLSKESNSSDDDLELLQHASAYHLKLSESLLLQIPDHVKLAESVVRGYTQYAFVFLMDEADRTESENLQKANQLRARAAKMMMRAKTIGLQALLLQYPQLETSLAAGKFAKPLGIAPEHTGLAYWTLTAWAGAISLSKDSPDIVADLPQVLLLSELAWKAKPSFDNGALAGMMGTLELAKPGGKPDQAATYFDQAIAWRGDQIAPLVSKAENWAVATQNKEAFTQLLNQALEEAKGKTDLSNAIMLRRARWLLDSIDNIF